MEQNKIIELHEHLELCHPMHTLYADGMEWQICDCGYILYEHAGKWKRCGKNIDLTADIISQWWRSDPDVFKKTLKVHRYVNVKIPRVFIDDNPYLSERQPEDVTSA